MSNLSDLITGLLFGHRSTITTAEVTLGTWLGELNTFKEPTPRKEDQMKLKGRLVMNCLEDQQPDVRQSIFQRRL